MLALVMQVDAFVQSAAVSSSLVGALTAGAGIASPRGSFGSLGAWVNPGICGRAEGGAGAPPACFGSGVERQANAIDV